MTIQPNDQVIILRGAHRGKLGRAHKFIYGSVRLATKQGGRSHV